jgi:hypothetical protein
MGRHPGRSWPVLPSHDKELCQAFLKGIRQQLRSNFVRHAETFGGRKDSSMGPIWRLSRTHDEILRLFDAIE